MSVFCDDRNIDFIERRKYHVKESMPFAHYHNYHELYYLVSGNVTFWVDDKIYHLIPGDILFAPKEVLHQTNYDRATNIERILIVFDDDTVGNEYIPYLQELSAQKHIRLLPESVSDFGKILNKIEMESSAHKKLYTEFRKLYLREALLLIHRFKIENIDNTLSPMLLLIQDAISYINENFKQDITVNSIAKHYSLSSGYLSRQFKKYTGLPPSEYISIVRIQNAQKLLSTTKKSIMTVAYECGYEDCAYFTRVFKKITGTSPKKYALSVNSNTP